MALEFGGIVSGLTLRLRFCRRSGGGRRCLCRFVLRRGSRFFRNLHSRSSLLLRLRSLLLDLRSFDIRFAREIIRHVCNLMLCGQPVEENRKFVRIHGSGGFLFDAGERENIDDILAFYVEILGKHADFCLILIDRHVFIPFTRYVIDCGR